MTSSAESSVADSAPSGPADERSWVCLMYHDVLPATEAAGGGPERFAAPVEAFEVMLDTIGEMGLAGCSVSEALAARGRGKVAISFDDGGVSQYLHAAPALESRGMTATFFVTSGWIGEPGFMSASQLRDLVGMGMSVQSHTRSHPFLSELDRNRLRSELLGSREDLETVLQREVDGISLPGGNAPRRRLRSELADSGYRWVAGSRWGRNASNRTASATGPWLRRCTMRGAMTPQEARRILVGDPSDAWRGRKEAVLNGTRALLGASRYARWRRWFLDRVR